MQNQTPRIVSSSSVGSSASASDPLRLASQYGVEIHVDLNTGLKQSFNMISQSFKAMTSGLRAQPDPFIGVLCEASQQGNIAHINGLLAQGVKIDSRNEAGKTPLICAIESGQVDSAKALLDAGADITVQDSSKKLPPLFHAVSVGSLEVAKLLLARGANVRETRWSGNSYFSDVVVNSNADGIKLLLDNGADANAYSLSGRSPLGHAVEKNSLEVAQLLISHGADVTAGDYMSGHNLLSLALNQKHSDMATLLLANKASPDSSDAWGDPLLSKYIKRYRKSEDEFDLEAILLLLDSGAATDMSDSWGTPIVCEALMSGNVQIITKMLKRGADANAMMSSGETMLLYAIDKKMVDHIEVFLDNKAKPDKQDKNGRTPLMEALKRNDVDLIRLLMQYKADVNMSGQITPLEFAKAIQNPEILQALGISPAPTSGPAERERTRSQETNGNQHGRSESPPPSYEMLPVKP